MSSTPLQKPQTQDEQVFVTKKFCKERMFITRWALGTILLLMAIFVVLVGLAATASSGAATSVQDVVKQVQPVTQRVNDLDAELTTHQAVQVANDKAVLKSLNEIKVELKDQRKEHTKLLERILTKTTP